MVSRIEEYRLFERRSLLDHLARKARSRGDYEEAFALARQAAWSGKRGEPHHELKRMARDWSMKILYPEERLCDDEVDPDLVWRCYREYSHLEAVRAGGVRFRTLSNLGRLACKMGHVEDAWNTLTRGLETATSLSDLSDLMLGFTELAHTLLERSETRRAIDAYREAIDLAAAVAKHNQAAPLEPHEAWLQAWAPLRQARNLEGCAEARLELGDVRGAQRDYEQALEIYRSVDARRDARDVDRKIRKLRLMVN